MKTNKQIKKELNHLVTLQMLGQDTTKRCAQLALTLAHRRAMSDC